MLDELSKAKDAAVEKTWLTSAALTLDEELYRNNTFLEKKVISSEKNYSITHKKLIAR